MYFQFCMLVLFDFWFSCMILAKKNSLKHFITKMSYLLWFSWTNCSGWNTDDVTFAWDISRGCSESWKLKKWSSGFDVRPSESKSKDSSLISAYRKKYHFRRNTVMNAVSKSLPLFTLTISYALIILNHSVS